MKPGRKSFYASNLRSACHALMHDVVSQQCTHREFLDMRTARIFQGPEWVKASHRARLEAYGYLDGFQDSLETCGHLVWAHWWEGKWEPRFSDKVNHRVHNAQTHSAFVWIASGKVWYGPDPRLEASKHPS